jgi:hypothetical protein
MENRQRERRDWRENLEKGKAAYADDPWPIGEVLRVYDVGLPENAADDLVTDLRTGTIHSGPMRPGDWRLILYQGLQQETSLVHVGP